MNKHPLLVENERIEYLLENLVNSFTSDAALRQDLMQEARIHLWRRQLERPGQTLSWYLRGCRFALHHFLDKGRSVDSGKRRAGQLHDSDGDSVDSLEQLRAENHTFDEACVRDLIATLALALKPVELAVLHCLADGLPTSLIAKRLNLSSPTVTKYRRKIARLATKFGIAAPPGPRPMWRLHVTRSPIRRKTLRHGSIVGANGPSDLFSSLHILERSSPETTLFWRRPVMSPEQAIDPAA